MKKNKKYYNFTEKQKRKDAGTKNHWGRVPASYRRDSVRKRRRQAGQVLIKILLGFNAEFRPDRKDVRWNYF